MKCPKCNGIGKTKEYDGLRKFWCDYKCDVCDGKGIVEPITEQEYLQSCNTEQLAEVLFQEYCNGRNDANTGDWEGVDTYMEWLKQPHTDKE